MLQEARPSALYTARARRGGHAITVAYESVVRPNSPRARSVARCVVVVATGSKRLMIKCCSLWMATQPRLLPPAALQVAHATPQFSDTEADTEPRAFFPSPLLLYVAHLAAHQIDPPYCVLSLLPPSRRTKRRAGPQLRKRSDKVAPALGFSPLLYVRLL